MSTNINDVPQACTVCGKVHTSTACDQCTGLACGDECDGKSHATTREPCNQCSIMGKDCAHCGPPSWEGFVPMNDIMPAAMTDRTCETCVKHYPECKCLLPSTGPEYPCHAWEPRPAAQDADDRVELRNIHTSKRHPGYIYAEVYHNGVLNMCATIDLCITRVKEFAENKNIPRRPSLPMSAEVEKAIETVRGILVDIIHVDGDNSFVRQFDLIVDSITTPQPEASDMEIAVKHLERLHGGKPGTGSWHGINDKWTDDELIAIQVEHDATIRADERRKADELRALIADIVASEPQQMTERSSTVDIQVDRKIYQEARKIAGLDA